MYLSPQPPHGISRYLVGVSAKINYEWALRQPGSPPFLLLTEFPRSGGNWIRDILADVLQMPAPRYSKLPVTFRAIVHSHDHRTTMHPTIYVVRDPRDVFLSHYHKCVSTVAGGHGGSRKRALELHPSLRVTPEEVCEEERLHAFYKEWKVRSIGVKVSWGAHVRRFLTHEGSNVVVIRYEDVHSDPFNTISNVVTQLTQSVPPVDLVKFAIWRNSFSMQTGRNAGVAQNTSTKRRGIVGAWRDELPATLATVITRDFQRAFECAQYNR